MGLLDRIWLKFEATVTPAVIAAARDRHVTMYTRRLRSDHEAVQWSETARLCRIWESVPFDARLRDLTIEARQELLDYLASEDWTIVTSEEDGEGIVLQIDPPHPDALPPAPEADSETENSNPDYWGGGRHE